MNYGHRQERAMLLIKAFRDRARVDPDSTLKGRTFAQLADEVERQTDGGREIVYFSSLFLRVLDSAPDPLSRRA